MKKYTADFETCVWLEDETFVWAWAVCEIGNEEKVITGNSIEGFMDYVESQKNAAFYFHNLHFDGSFILHYLIKNDFKFVEDRKDYSDKTFSCLISELGQFYQITVIFKKKNKSYVKATFYDSLKIIPMKVKDIAKSFNLPISKLEIDYQKPRPRNPELTQEEIDYIKNDVKIVAMALKTLFDKGLTRMTAASNALNDYKTGIGKSRFERLYPELSFEEDSDLRKSFKGGFTFVNPIYKGKEVSEGVVLDVNSLYPSVMHEKPLCYGEAIFFEGKYVEDKIYPLYIQSITCKFKLKKNKIPTIQIKDSFVFLPNQYIESTEGDFVTLVLTNIDLKLFFEQYDVSGEIYNCGWKFKSMTGLFTKYIDKWIAEKNEGTIEGNKGKRTRAKLMLNSLYGKFAKSMKMVSKIPYEIGDDILRFDFGNPKQVKGLYLPVASFITAYAREKTIRTSQAIQDYSIQKYGVSKYYYSDTDSIHCGLSIDELKQFCEIDDVKLRCLETRINFFKS